MTEILARVADASVFAAVAFEEERAGEAEALLEGAALHAPALLLYELASIARNKTLREPDRREAFAQGLTNVLALDIALAPADSLAILALALETGLTPYDASYLHLATTLGLPLATFDTKLRAAAEGRATVL